MEKTKVEGEGGGAGVKEREALESLTLPELEVTPDVGLLHPLLRGEGGVMKFASNPKSCE